MLVTAPLCFPNSTTIRTNSCTAQPFEIYIHYGVDLDLIYANPALNDEESCRRKNKKQISIQLISAWYLSLRRIKRNQFWGYRYITPIR